MSGREDGHMKPGKLPHDLLAKMLGRLPAGDARVVVGPGVGEDAAVIEFGDRLLVAKTDPITFATDLIGWYAVHVNANDIAAMGAEPRWFMASLLLPETASEADVTSIFTQITEACTEIGATTVGGHTEITIGLERPILVGCMLGEVARQSLITSAGARPSDVVILTRGLAIEGTALLARELRPRLLSKGLSDAAVDQARDLLFSPGLSVLAASRAAMGAGGVTAMHDPTEGGLATGLREIAIASKVGLDIDADAIPVLPLTQQVCAALSLDPLGLIASGSLLVTAHSEAGDDIVEAVHSSGDRAAIIGRVLPEGEGLSLVAGGERKPLPQFPRDEIARLFEQPSTRRG